MAVFGMSQSMESYKTFNHHLIHILIMTHLLQLQVVEETISAQKIHAQMVEPA
jgi:hypothetical protein